MLNSTRHSLASRAAAGALTALSFVVTRAATDPAPDANAARAALAPAQADLPISLDTRSLEFDRETNRMALHSVIITQGRLRVEAREATATNLNFENSEWQFTGDVRITMEKGSLSSDRADVEFAKNQIARAVINGAPANFEQKLDQPPQIARGRANIIEYDVAHGTVKLTENAWLSDGENELSGAVLVYDIRSERVVANAAADSDARVRITINPRTRKPATPPADPSQ